jgi:hypothetical protein
LLPVVALYFIDERVLVVVVVVGVKLVASKSGRLFSHLSSAHLSLTLYYISTDSYVERKTRSHNLFGKHHGG